MQDRQAQMLEALHNARAFLEGNAGPLGGTVNAALRQAVDDRIAGLTTFALEQAGSTLTAQGTTQKHRALRDTLVHEHMAPIAGIALLALPATPELRPLRLPRGRLSASQLAVAAYAMAKTATPFRRVFVAGGRPADFAAQLTGAADAMMASLRDRARTQHVRRGATSGVRGTVREAGVLLRALDTLVKAAIRKDPARLAAWTAAKRLRQPSSAGRITPATPPVRTAA